MVKGKNMRAPRSKRNVPNRSVAVPRRIRQRPRANVSRMTPAACRALALSSPCVFADAVQNGKAVMDHARDPSSAGATTVQLIKGVAQFTANSDGNAGVIIAPTLRHGIEVFTDSESTDVWTDIPGAAAAAGVSATYRVISAEVDLLPTTSYMQNQGSVYMAGLDPALGDFDYRNYAGVTLAARVANLRNIIDDRPRGTYSAGAFKDPQKVVISRQFRSGFVTADPAPPSWWNSIGDDFVSPSLLADTNYMTQTYPLTKFFRVQDQHAVCAIAVTGAAANAPFQLQICMLVEIVPSSTVMGTTLGLAAPAAGVAVIAKAMSHMPSVNTLEKVEHGAERVLEFGLNAAGIAGVPGASAAAEGLHVGQNVLERVEHSKFGHYLGFS